MPQISYYAPIPAQVNFEFKFKTLVENRAYHENLRSLTSKQRIEATMWFPEDWENKPFTQLFEDLFGFILVFSIKIWQLVFKRGLSWAAL